MDNNTELLNALKIAFCYMPELQDLTKKDYAGSLPKVKEEVALVRQILSQNDIDPDELYESLNPIIKTKSKKKSHA